MKKIFAICCVLTLLTGVASIGWTAETKQLPSVPTNASAQIKSDGSVLLVWEPALYGETYQISRAKEMETDAWETVITGVKEAFYQDENDGTYPYYQIIALNPHGQSVPLRILAAPALRIHSQLIVEGITAYDMALVGDYLYAANDTIGISIYKAGEEWSHLKDVNRASFCARSMAVKGDKLYVGGQHVKGGGSILVYDIGDPENPKLLDACVSKSPNRIKIAEDLLYTPSSNGVELFDISEANRLRKLTNAGASSLTAACIDGTNLYTGNANGVFSIYNLINPFRPYCSSVQNFAFSKFETDYTGRWREYTEAPKIYDIAAKDGYVILANDRFVKVVQITDTRHPLPMFELDDSFVPYTSEALCIDGNLLYLADNAKSTLQVYNISNLQKPPILLSSIALKDGISSIRVYDGRIYVANKTQGITVIQL